MAESESPSALFSRISLNRNIGSFENDFVNTRSKQPKALEDGNWVCDDPSCVNVNYPRRTECNKCGKKRGPSGDAVVKAYLENVRLIRGEMTTSLPYETTGNGYHEASAYSFYPMTIGNGVRGAVPRQQGSQFLAACSNNSSFLPRNKGLVSAQTEGKRLAEQLIATFAFANDPISEAGECLATASLWLQTLRSRMQMSPDPSPLNSQAPFAASSGIFSTSLSQIPTQNLGNVSRGLSDSFSSARVGAYNENKAIWNSYSGIGATGSGIPVNNLSDDVYGLGNGMDHSYTSFPSFGNRNFLGSAPPKQIVTFEEYKDRPSDYLREFGDPAAVTASVVGPAQNVRPEPGINGNWECEDCKNVNFPRRTYCFQCQKKRGQKGEEVVREYVRRLIEG